MQARLSVSCLLLAGQVACTYVIMCYVNKIMVVKIHDILLL